MKIIQSENFIIGHNANKPIVADITYNENQTKLPVIIFCHGYKGYKDWGAWNIMARSFAENGFLVLKFNFSHNGGTFNQPIDFSDLEAFSEDNFSKQLNDLEKVINFVVDENSVLPDVDVNKIYLIGHSRGGGITLIKTAENEHVKKVITLASVADFESRLPTGEALEEWKEKGVYFVKNGRTGQDMPHKFQFYNDLIENRERLNIINQTKKIKCPILIIHGTTDETVTVNDAIKLKKANNNCNMILINGAGHTFNTSHPWKSNALPKALNEVIEASIKFLKN